LTKLDASIPRLTDIEIVIRLMKLMCLVGDGHTDRWMGDGCRFPRYTLPLEIYLIEEGLDVVAVDPRYPDLLGTQVLRFGERTTEEVMREIDPLLSRNNPQWVRHRAPLRMRQLPLLHAPGLIPEAETVVLTVRDQGGTTRAATLAPDETQPSDRDPYSFPYLSGWLSLPETLATPPRLSLDVWGRRLGFRQKHGLSEGRTGSLTTFSSQVGGGDRCDGEGSSGHALYPLRLRSAPVRWSLAWGC